jgi:hypothetical protein
MRIFAGALLLLFLSACGQGGIGTGPVTISDPMAYLAQSKKPDGNVSTPLSGTDGMVYRRFDFGHVQAEDSFLTGPTTAITAWSYSPWGEFVDSNGDGGEVYSLQGNIVHITSTKHLGVPTTPISWVALRTDTIDCSQGWTSYSVLERGCKATVSYPNIGPIDTIISEHLNPVERFVERIFLGRGWGRLAWQTFRATGAPAPDRCPSFGWNEYQNWILTDCRYVVNIEPANGTLSGSMLWHP